MSAVGLEQLVLEKDQTIQALEKKVKLCIF
jgi:hypothetical protein